MQTPSPPPASLVAQLTDAATPIRFSPLTKTDATVILSHVYTRLLFAPCVDPGDLLARLDAERDLLRLRSQIHNEVFG